MTEEEYNDLPDWMKDDEGNIVLGGMEDIDVEAIKRELDEEGIDYVSE